MEIEDEDKQMKTLLNKLKEVMGGEEEPPRHEDKEGQAMVLERILEPKGVLVPDGVQMDSQVKGNMSTTEFQQKGSWWEDADFDNMPSHNTYLLHPVDRASM